MNRTEYYMHEALREAEAAQREGEIPVGAVIVKDDIIIARAHNTREQRNDPLGHAELSALSAASAALGSWRLDGCDLYVTLEPCPMCAGAVLNARLRRVYFGAYDEVFGAVGSKFNLFYDHRWPNPVCFAGGILEAPCRALLQEFFRKRRERP